MQTSYFQVDGLVAAVTGATGVLGGALARGLAAHGVRVAVLGRRREQGERVVGEIRDTGGDADFFPLDVTSLPSCREVAGQVHDRFDQVDVLINSAGGNFPGATASDDQPFFDLDEEAMRQVMDLNAMGSILPCQTFGRLIAEQGRGSIINVSSMAALRPLTRVVGYSAAKAAVSNFTQWLSVHMCQQYGAEIRVNAIAPGFFLTDQNRYLLTQAETGELTARGQQIIEHTPMGRFGDPEELVGTALWLISPAARFVTGIVVPVDGGFSAFAGV